MITMEIKLKTRDRLELDVLDTYIPQTKDIKISYFNSLPSSSINVKYNFSPINLP